MNEEQTEKDKENKVHTKIEIEIETNSHFLHIFFHLKKSNTAFPLFEFNIVKLYSTQI